MHADSNLITLMNIIQFVEKASLKYFHRDPVNLIIVEQTGLIPSSGFYALESMQFETVSAANVFCAMLLCCTSLGTFVFTK